MGREREKTAHGGNNPTAAVIEYRRPIFQPVKHAERKPIPWDTGTPSFGRIRVVRGGVTQHHRDLIDILRMTSKFRLRDETDQEHLIFDVTDLGKWGISQNWCNIKETLTDLLGCVIRIEGETADSWGAAFPIATFLGDAKTDAPRLPHQYKAKLKRLVLSAQFTALLEQHATVTLSRETLKTVVDMRHAVSKAVARWCLTHSRDQTHNLATVLAAVGAINADEPIQGRESSRRARRLIQWLGEDAPLLDKLGIRISKDEKHLKLHYHRQPGAFITAAGDA